MKLGHRVVGEGRREELRSDALTLTVRKDKDVRDVDRECAVGHCSDEAEDRVILNGNLGKISAVDCNPQQVGTVSVRPAVCAVDIQNSGEILLGIRGTERDQWAHGRHGSTAAPA